MTESFGNLPEPAIGPETKVAAASEPQVVAGAEARKSYHKPALKRLGLLRSVTGSDIVF